jgi:hypothetical protein
MTDVKGLERRGKGTLREVNTYFDFMERGNWLTFQDSYPQLLLYKESLIKKQNLFHLLRYFHVSLFMEVMWSSFLSEQNFKKMTYALIINEQSYLESRIHHMKDNQNINKCTLPDKKRENVNSSNILLPFSENRRINTVKKSCPFTCNLEDRISIGKQLYHALFSDSKRLKLFLNWANNTVHTGSRMDYRPQIYHDKISSSNENILNIYANGYHTPLPSTRIYSPKLESVWKSCKHKQAEKGDWYDHWKVIYYLIDNEKEKTPTIHNNDSLLLKIKDRTALLRKAVSFSS